MAESIFRAEGGRLVPTEQALGPWDANALHGGAAAALMAGALEAAPTDPRGERLPVARLTFEFLRPIPRAPLTLTTRVVRPGRRVQGLEAELHHGETLVCRCGALRAQPVGEDIPSAGAEGADVSGAGADGADVSSAGERGASVLPGPEEGRPLTFSLDETQRASFAATAIEMRWLSGDDQLGPAIVWMRLRHPVVPGEPVTALMRTAAAADFGNGVSAVLPWTDFLFINADLTIQLHRPPEGEWIAVDARTHLAPGGTGLAESVLHDRRGPVGRALQSLVVQRR
jgi:acyl-CoA thioesterase